MNLHPMDQLETVKQLRSRVDGLLATCQVESDRQELGVILEELRLKENKFKALFPTFKLRQEDMDEVGARVDAIESRNTSS